MSHQDWPVVPAIALAVSDTIYIDPLGYKTIIKYEEADFDRSCPRIYFSDGTHVVCREDREFPRKPRPCT